MCLIKSNFSFNSHFILMDIVLFLQVISLVSLIFYFVQQNAWFLFIISSPVILPPTFYVGGLCRNDLFIFLVVFHNECFYYFICIFWFSLLGFCIELFNSVSNPNTHFIAACILAFYFLRLYLLFLLDKFSFLF